MSAGHTEHKSHFVEYMVVFAVLAILTVVELFIPGANVAHAYKAAALTFLAVGKAMIVAYFYMHLKEEKRWLKVIAAVPISAVIFAVGLILEGMYR